MADKNNPFSYKKATDSTGFLLWQVHNLWQREIKKNLKPLDLTHTQFVILANAHWLVLHNETDITQIDIAQHAKTDIMMTSNVIRTLEKKGFISRREHETDTRAKVVQLTEKGLEILKKAVTKVEAFDRNFFSKLKDTTTFNRELIILMDAG